MKTEESAFSFSATWYKALGVISSAAGIGMLVLIFTQIRGDSPDSSADELLKWTLLDKLFFLHVPLLVSILMTVGGLGLILSKTWSWNLLTVPAAVVVVMSVFLLLSSGDKRIGAFLDDYLPVMLGLQALGMGTLFLMLTGNYRKAHNIRTSDLLIAALFTVVLLLDWFVSLYEGISRPW